MKTVSFFLMAFLVVGCLQKRNTTTDPVGPTAAKLNGLVRVNDVTGEKNEAIVIAAFWEPESEPTRSFRIEGNTPLRMPTPGKCATERLSRNVRERSDYLDMGKMGFGIEGALELINVPKLQGNIYYLVTTGGLTPSRYDIGVEGNETFKGFAAQALMPEHLDGLKVNEVDIDAIDAQDISRSTDIKLVWEAPPMMSGYYEMGIEIIMPKGNEDLIMNCSVYEQDLDPNRAALIEWTISSSELSAFGNGAAEMHVYREVNIASGTKDKSIVLLLQGRRTWLRQINLID